MSPTSLARHRRAPLIVALLGAFTLGAVALVAACSSQSEGARCQLDNDESNGTNEDCEDGLVCVASKDLPLDPIYRGQVSDREGRCCPADRSRATVAECKQTPPAPGADASIPVEAGGDGGGTDAGQDSSQGDSASDAPSEAAPDSSSDAPSDAPDAG